MVHGVAILGGGDGVAACGERDGVATLGDGDGIAACGERDGVSRFGSMEGNEAMLCYALLCYVRYCSLWRSDIPFNLLQSSQDYITHVLKICCTTTLHMCRKLHCTVRGLPITLHITSCNDVLIILARRLDMLIHFNVNMGSPWAPCGTYNGFA